LDRTLASQASQYIGKPAASLLLHLNIEAPAEMAAGVASVEVLCAGAAESFDDRPLH
jgi:hypothetical protein